LENFNVENFVKKQIKNIHDVIGDKKAVIAVSGGVDSTTCAELTYRAIGDNLICIILDTAFMREGEPKKVASILSSPPLNLPIKIKNVQEKFLDELSGISDAEKKRKAFRKVFYESLSDIVKHEKSQILVQGTILADIIETAGGIKTQHNVLDQIGISSKEIYGFKVVEPLVTLLKWQVREVAKYLNIPPAISDRQPFPGPGLSVRVVGEITPPKLSLLKKATKITEKQLSYHKSSQYFVAIINNKKKIVSEEKINKIKNLASETLGFKSEKISVKVYSNKATGIEDKTRKYGEIIGLTCKELENEIYQPNFVNLMELHKKICNENPSITRVLYNISEDISRNPYVIIIRSIETSDFLTAKISNIPWSTLNKTANLILEEGSNISTIYYDVTPKPPATIEME
jgi:GMP synthase (glutamine-hydrolysing)